MNATTTEQSVMTAALSATSPELKATHIAASPITANVPTRHAWITRRILPILIIHIRRHETAGPLPIHPPDR